MKNVTLRFGVNNWKLIPLSKHDLCHIQSKDECINLLTEAPNFSTLEANMYWQIEIEETDREKNSVYIPSRNIQIYPLDIWTTRP